MIRSLFVSMQELNKGARRPKDVPPQKFKKVGIIGAGFMGASIGYVTALAGIEVVLIDRDQESADKGKPHSHKLMTEQVNRGRATAAERDALLGAHHAERRLRRACGLRPRDRGGVRGSQGQGRDDQEGAGRDRRQDGVRVEHLDAADHLAGGRVQGPGALHRHPFLLAGRAHDAGRDHPRQEDRRRRRSRPRSISCARSARRRSWSTTRAASSPIAACSTTSRKAT